MLMYNRRLSWKEPWNRCGLELVLVLVIVIVTNASLGCRQSLSLNILGK